MTTLTVAAQGQATFSDLLPDGREELKADRGSGSWRELSGMLRDKTNGVRLSIDDINDAIAEAGMSGIERP